MSGYDYYERPDTSGDDGGKRGDMSVDYGRCGSRSQDTSHSSS